MALPITSLLRLFAVLAMGCVIGLAGCAQYRDIDKSALLWLPTLLENDQSFTLGGTVIDLIGTDLVLSAAGQELTLSGDGVNPVTNGFSFPERLPVGSSYSVTILSQPHTPIQDCSISGGSGTIGGGNVNSIVVNCGSSGVIGGNITGYDGSGLVLSQSGETLAVAAGATNFAFGTPLYGGSNWNISVVQQPTTPSQLCSVTTNATGTMPEPASDQLIVEVDCVTSSYQVGGTVTGLTTTGLELSLTINGTLQQTLSAAPGPPGTYQFTTNSPYLSGSNYTVAIATQPDLQNCTIDSAASGAIGAVDIAINLSCVDSHFLVHGLVNGLSGENLSLQMSGDSTQNRTISAPDTSYSFPTAVADGSSITITIATPDTATTNPVQSCYFIGGLSTTTVTITGGGVNVTPAIECVTNEYEVRAEVHGLDADELQLQLNGGTVETLIGDVGTDPQYLSFGSIASGTNFTLSIVTQPAGLACTIPDPTHTVVSAIVTVVVNCTGDSYNLSGDIFAALTADIGLRLTAGGSDYDITATGNNYNFAQAIFGGQSYTLAITSQPTGFFCYLPGGTGDDPQSVTAVVDGGNPATYTQHITCDQLYRIDYNLLQIYPAAGDQVTVLASGPDYSPGMAPANLLLTANAVSNGNLHYRNGREYTLSLTPPAHLECELATNLVTIAGVAPEIAITCRNLYSEVAPGLAHTLAIRQDGRLFGWGNNIDGQLGIGNYDSPKELPVLISNEVGWSAVSAGQRHSLGILNGNLMGWGESNVYQQLCSTTSTNLPTEINAGPGWSEVMAGGRISLALKGGELWACGESWVGEPGLAEGIYGTLTRVGAFADATNIVGNIDIGGLARSFLIRSGVIYSTGSGQIGAHGLGDFTTVYSHQQVTAVTGCSEVVAGLWHGMALCGGNHYAWGDNSIGTFGNGTTTGATSPMLVDSGYTWSQLSAGDEISFGITSDGRLFSWGLNKSLQLGIGSFTGTATSTSPSQIMAGSDNWQKVRGRAIHHGAINSSGQLYMWGSGTLGRLGNGASVDQAYPVRIY